MTKENIVRAPSARVRRAPVARRNVLTVEGKEPGFVYRIVNDTEDRVSEFERMGYEVVSAKSVKIGDKRVDQTSTEGSIARISVGGGVRGVLMRQKQEWYDEDQRAKIEYVEETERATIREAREGQGRYGKVEISSSL